MKLSELYRRQEERKRAGYEAAQKLDTVGMGVYVDRDDGETMMTTLKSLPWTLGSGHWVAKVDGISGGYDCARIRPAGGKGKKS